MLILLSSLALAQSSSDTWRTVETEHYRFHYPLQAEPWALQAAAQAEAIRDNTAELIGYEPEVVIDVLVMDPFTQANGWAMPHLRRPRMGLYASPPPADSVLGHYRSWQEDLITHEDAHQVHLLIPGRHPAAGVASWLPGYGPVARKSPRWVAEGYATVIEGKLTGWGRPNSTGRRVFLATLVQHGAMPGYGELNLSMRWNGMSYAYLVGSAYLEWLEAREGEGSLEELWTAMSAHELRSFEDAFIAVFHEHPETLYMRFVAELTAEVVGPELGQDEAVDSLWIEGTETTGAPALSRDGSQLAYVDRGGFHPRLVVRGSGQDEEARTSWAEADAERLDKDPEDVLVEEPRVFAAEETAKRIRPTRNPAHLRWTWQDTLVFTSWVGDDGGQLHPEVFEWDPVSGEERRVTSGESVQQADPIPGARQAVGVRTAWGNSQLVLIDLDSGWVAAITEPEATLVHDSPRVDPRGQQVVYLRNHPQVGWQVVLRQLSGGDERVLAFPTGETPSGPSWTPDGQAVLISTGDRVLRLPVDGAPPRVLVHRVTGAMSPAMRSDGSGLFFLSAQPEGLDLHHLSAEQLIDEPFLARELPTPPPPPELEPVSPGRYAPGMPWLSMGADVSLSHQGWALGPTVQLADRAGKGELLIFTIFDAEGLEAASARAATYALRTPISVTGFSAHDALGERQLGGLGEVSLSEVWDGGLVEGRVGGWVDQRSAAGFGRLEAGQRLVWGRSWLALSVEGDLQAGRAEGAAKTWTLADGTATASLGWLGTWLSLEHGRGSTSRPSGLVLGGLQLSATPQAWVGNRVFAPGLEPGLLAGSSRSSWTAQIISPVALGARAERHVFGDEAVSQVALVATGADIGSPMDWRPSLSLDAGVSCQLEDASGVVDKACRKKEHYGLWLGTTWVPRRR